MTAAETFACTATAADATNTAAYTTANAHVEGGVWGGDFEWCPHSSEGLWPHTSGLTGGRDSGGRRIISDMKLSQP